MIDILYFMIDWKVIALDPKIFFERTSTEYKDTFFLFVLF